MTRRQPRQTRANTVTQQRLIRMTTDDEFSSIPTTTTTTTTSTTTPSSPSSPNAHTDLDGIAWRSHLGQNRFSTSCEFSKWTTHRTLLTVFPSAGEPPPSSAQSTLNGIASSMHPHPLSTIWSTFQSRPADPRLFPAPFKSELLPSANHHGPLAVCFRFYPLITYCCVSRSSFWSVIGWCIWCRVRLSSSCVL